MIKLLKDKKAGWWIEVWDETCKIDAKCGLQRLAVTAEEVLSLLNQIKEQQPKLLKEI